ncbi:hypothetical protein G6O67_004255 [Ophiocordyceps sinensis]|uniref:Uncharacterized protein n=1 Tax=Ophiocordyceps sinensis TaxID=72228 RepID=A0A8H4LZW6_9HYPO|nr:hypothetical protein G6O67_004255 [Ophiocordyceps sinensis]
MTGYKMLWIENRLQSRGETWCDLKGLNPSAWKVESRQRIIHKRPCIGTCMRPPSKPTRRASGIRMSPIKPRPWPLRVSLSNPNMSILTKHST